MLFASLPWTKPMAAETRLRSRRGLRALAARAARRARSMQHVPLPAGTRTAIQRVSVCDVALRERFSPFLKHVCSRRTARILQLRVLGDALVHTEASLDAESHAYATLKQLAD